MNDGCTFAATGAYRYYIGANCQWADCVAVRVNNYEGLHDRCLSVRSSDKAQRHDRYNGDRSPNRDKLHRDPPNRVGFGSFSIRSIDRAIAPCLVALRRSKQPFTRTVLSLRIDTCLATEELTAEFVLL